MWGHLEPVAHVQVAFGYLWRWKLYNLPNSLCFTLIVKKIVSWHSYRNSYVPICAIASGPANCGGSWKNRQKLQFYSVCPSAFMCSLVCRLRALVMHIIHDFPHELPWNRLNLTVRPRYKSWTSDQFLWLSLSVAFEPLWKIQCFLPCRDSAVLENGICCAAGPCVLEILQ